MSDKLSKTRSTADDQTTESRSSLAKRLGTYAAIGAGCTTFAATAVDADIIYTDLRGGNELVFRTTNSDTLGVDLDNDGNRDFRLQFRTNFNKFGTFSTLVDLSATAGFPATNAFIGTDFYVHGPSVFGLPEGFAFSHFANYWFKDAALAYHYTQFLPSLTGGQFPFGVPRYAGVRFQDGTGNTRFGWIEFISGVNFQNGLDSGDRFFVTQYAYAVDRPILIGQTTRFFFLGVPEPSTMTSIGLLALGAAGLPMRRRRKSDELQESDSDT